MRRITKVQQFLCLSSDASLVVVARLCFRKLQFALVANCWMSGLHKIDVAAVGKNNKSHNVNKQFWSLKTARCWHKTHTRSMPGRSWTSLCILMTVVSPTLQSWNPVVCTIRHSWLGGSLSTTERWYGRHHFSSSDHSDFVTDISWSEQEGRYISIGSRRITRSSTV